MALIQSGVSTDLLTIDPSSKAARVTIYDPDGNISGSSHPSSKVIQNNATVTTGGNFVFINVDSPSISLFVNIEAVPTGTLPTLTYTVSEVDPSDQASIVGQTITGAPLNAIGTQVLNIEQIKSNTILISWVIGGTGTPSFTRVNSVIVGQDNGIVTANITNIAGLALNATLTNGTQQSKVTDGTNIAAVKAASTAAIATDPALVVAISPNNPISLSGTVTANQGVPNTIGNSWPVEITDGTNVLGVSAHPVRIDPTGTTTQPVSGTITANAGTGNFTVIQTTAANLNATVTGTVISNIGTTNGLALDSSLTTIDTDIKATQPRDITDRSGRLLGHITVDNFPGTQPISGTVIANVGTTNGLALDTSVNGILVAQGSTTSGELGPLVQGAVTTTAPTYTTAKTSPLSLTTSGALRTDSSSVTQPISGTVTSNIGTTNGLLLDSTFTGRINTFGQKTMANSTPIVVSSDQSAIPVSQSGTWTVQQGSSPWGVKTEVELDYDTGAGTQNLSVIGLALPASGGSVAGGTLTNPIRVDPTGTTTQPISGTVTANAGSGTFTVSGTVTSNQGGTWTVQPGNTANTTPWLATINQGGNSAIVSAGGALKIDGSSVTQPVSGTITANIGTSGSLALDTSVTGLQISQGSTTSGQKGNLIIGAVTTSAPSYTTAQSSPLSLTTSGSLRVDGSGSTQPVSGTITANAGSGTFTVSGTVTSNIGTTNGLALDASVNGVLVSQGSATSGEKGPLIQGAVTTVAPTYTTAQTSPLSLTTTGLLRMDGSGVTQPVSGTVTANQGGAPWSANITQFGGTNISTGTGASGTGIPRVTVANDSNILATQSGSWTVTSNQGTANSLANAWSTKITDTTNGPVAVKAASTAAIATDPALVVAVSPNNVVTTNSGIQVSNVDAGNSSTTPLSGNATFTGTGIDVSGYGVITVFVFADQSGTLNLEFSTNNSNWDDILPYTISASIANHVQIGPQAKFFRVVYTNGSVAQSTFRLQTIEKPITAFNPVVPVSSVIDTDDDAILTKSVITGRTSTGINKYQDVQVNSNGNLLVSLGDSPSVSAFGSLRTAEPLTLFSNKQIFDSQPLYWDDQQTAGASTSSTFLTNKAATQITVAQNVAGTRVRQSFRRVNYQPGKGQLALFTAVLVNEGGSGNAAVNRRVGLFDSNNGFFFELTGTTMNVAIRTFTSGSAVTTYTAQSSWNIDKLDGTGSSGITLDVSKSQIFVIDFQWLGTGRIRYGFDIGGVIIYCHQTLIANTQSLVSISNPNLPCRFEIQSLGTGGASTSSMQHICATIISEGGQTDVGFTFGVDTGSTVLTTGNNTSDYALIALQLQSTMLSATIEPTFFTVVSATANAQFRVALILNPTVAGTALSFTPVTNSALQFAVGVANNTVTGGTVIYSGYFQSNKTGAASDQLTLDIALGSNIAGTSDTLVLVVQPTPALATSFLGSFNWKESI